jgi:hypothetical protein
VKIGFINTGSELILGPGGALLCYASSHHNLMDIGFVGQLILVCEYEEMFQGTMVCNPGGLCGQLGPTVG